MTRRIWFLYLELVSMVRKNGLSMMFLTARKIKQIKEDFIMKKKLNFFCWKIGPISETVYPTIETEVTAIS